MPLQPPGCKFKRQLGRIITIKILRKPAINVQHFESVECHSHTFLIRFFSFHLYQGIALKVHRWTTWWGPRCHLNLHPVAIKVTPKPPKPRDNYAGANVNYVDAKWAPATGLFHRRYRALGTFDQREDRSKEWQNSISFIRIHTLDKDKPMYITGCIIEIKARTGRKIDALYVDGATYCSRHMPTPRAVLG